MSKDGYVVTLQIELTEMNFDKLCNLIWSVQELSHLYYLLFHGFNETDNGYASMIYTLDSNLRQNRSKEILRLIRTLLDLKIATIDYEQSYLPASFETYLLKARPIRLFRPLQLDNGSITYLLKVFDELLLFDRTVRKSKDLSAWDLVIRCDRFSDSASFLGLLDMAPAVVLMYKNFIVNFNAVHTDEEGELHVKPFEVYSLADLLPGKNLVQKQTKEFVDNFVTWAKTMTI